MEGRHTRRKKKKWPVVLIVVVSILLVILIAAAVIINSFLSMINYDDPYKKAPVGGDILAESVDPITEGLGELPDGLQQFEPIIESEDVVDIGQVTDGFDMSKLGEYQDTVRRWTGNGRPISSEKVINILLIGMDGNGLQYNSRADAIVLMSVNTEKKTIYLTSLLRDSYTYNTDGTREIFEKLNLSNTRGGPEMLISAIERHYKIQIDNYVAVSLDTFPDVVDTVGGIEINISAEEAKALEIHPGVQTLDGDTALAYTRIRKIDSDFVRTSRHQAALLALFNKAKASGPSNMIDMISALLPSVRTGFTKADVLGLGIKAVTSGWTDYEIVTATYPLEESRVGQTVDGLFYWIIDYPHAAQSLQTAIYGKSNIILE